MRISDWSSDVCSSDLLVLSEMLPEAGRTFHAAYQLGLMEHGDAIDAAMKTSGIDGGAARRLCRAHLASYFAAAVMMPYERFLQAAESLRYDVEILSRRFGASFEQVCHRLTTLPRPGAQIGRAHVCTPVTNAHLVC